MSDSIDTEDLRSAFDNLLDVESTVNIPADGFVPTINFVATPNVLTDNTEITQFPPPTAQYTTLVFDWNEDQAIFVHNPALRHVRSP